MPVEYTYWDEEKTKKKSEFHRDNYERLHRTDGPAIILYSQYGSIYHIDYYLNGKMHNLTGKAWARYDDDGKVENGEYWVNDERVGELEWETHPLVIAALINKKLWE